MSEGVAGVAYTLQNLQDMLGITRSDVMGFIREGFVTPTRGTRNTYRFGFQDVVLLRTAQTLRRSNIPAARVRKALRRLKTLLPAEMPLSGLRISALGDAVAVHQDGRQVAAETGQLLFDFEVASTGGSVLSFTPVPHDASSSDPEPATLPVQIYLDRGARLVDRGASGEALATYDEGVATHPTDAELQFNRAVVLEDLARLDDAVTAYQRCLALEPEFADAHWNLARLYEIRNVKTLALRHFSAYRRLTR